MNFFESWGFYFTNIFDATGIIQTFIYAAILVIIDFKKELSVKNILITIIKFIGCYTSFTFFSSFAFALESLTRTYGMMMTIIPAVTIGLYIILFVKDNWLYKFIKFSLVLASVLVSSLICRDLGIVAGKLSGDDFISVVCARSLPSLLCIPIAYIMHRFDISKYKSVSLPLLISFICIAYLLVITSLVETMVIRSHEFNLGVYYLFTFIYVISLFVLVVLYFSSYYLVKTQNNLIKSEINTTLAEAKLDAIKVSSYNLEELHKVRHDLKNHFSYISALLEEEKVDDAKNYLKELNEENKDILESFSCANELINSIINLELSKAQLMKIKMDVKAIVPITLPFKDSDLVSLLTNLIDNAIENHDNSNKLPIKVHISMYQDYLRILVANKVKDDDVQKARVLKTSKSRLHGYGTKIIKHISRKYSGYTTFSIESNNTFVADCLISTNIEKE